MYYQKGENYFIDRIADEILYRYGHNVWRVEENTGHSNVEFICREYIVYAIPEHLVRYENRLVFTHLSSFRRPYSIEPEFRSFTFAQPRFGHISGGSGGTNGGGIWEEIPSIGELEQGVPASTEKFFDSRSIKELENCLNQAPKVPIQKNSLRKVFWHRYLQTKKLPF